MVFEYQFTRTLSNRAVPAVFRSGLLVAGNVETAIARVRRLVSRASAERPDGVRLLDAERTQIWAAPIEQTANSSQ